MMSRLILGLNTDHAGASAALLGEDGVLGAIAEERINRQKNSAAFPAGAIREVLSMAGAEIGDVTDFAVARDPRANLAKKLGYLARHPWSAGRMAVRRFGVHAQVRSTAERIAEGLGVERAAIRGKFHQIEHHRAHIASAFYCSPFERCCGLSIDGAGDFATSMWADCAGTAIDVVRRSYWPHSLGVFYTALCQFIGFDRFGEEYKVMGLAAYGSPSHLGLMRELVGFDRRRGLWLDLSYFSHTGRRAGFESIREGKVHLPPLWGQKLTGRLGPPRQRAEPLGDRDRDLASSIQARFEEVFLAMVDALVERTGQRRIVLAGGSVLNSVANGRMITEGHVDEAYFQPAAADDGTALGAAACVLHETYGAPRNPTMSKATWGTEWPEETIREALKSNGRGFQRLTEADLLDRAAAAIASGKVVGWFQGREEWGPRALGNRSILCNPANPEMKAILNARIKNREPFRPFAPVVQEEDLEQCFEGSHPVPFMIIVYKVRPEWRERLPAITHEDGTGRVQTVRRQDNPLFYELLTTFKRVSGVPALLNTSFNENEPIVHTPEQAIGCFERTKMDCLGIGPFWLTKTES